MSLYNTCRIVGSRDTDYAIDSRSIVPHDALGTQITAPHNKQPSLLDVQITECHSSDRIGPPVHLGASRTQWRPLSVGAPNVRKTQLPFHSFIAVDIAAFVAVLAGSSQIQDAD